MPELPEVETVCRVMRRALKGKRIKDVEVVPDDIIMKGHEPEEIAAALKGRRVVDVGRKGKIWWLELDKKPWLFGHLGMSGWIRELGKPTTRLKEHGTKPLDDEAGRPRFLKLLMEAEDGARVSFTDGRRLGRLWLSEGPETDKKVQALGFDCFDELPPPAELRKFLQKRKAPIKAVLLDQTVFAGVGNWIADEVLYHSRIAPKRLANSLSIKEIGKLEEAIRNVLETAVNAGADEKKYPKDWLFLHRWGGKRGVDEISGQTIVREPVGGRTTAWVPKLQR